MLWNRHGLTDREQIAKIYLTEGSSSELNAGGKLNPDQQLAVYNAIRARSTLLGPVMGAAPQSAGAGIAPANTPDPMLPNLDSIGGPAPQATGGPGISFINHQNGRLEGTIEGFVRSGHIVKPATQATALAGSVPSILKPRVRNWALKKFGFGQAWSAEEAFNTIYEDRFTEFLMSAMVPMAVHDLEVLALYGDEDTVPDGLNPELDLLSINDGWLKQMNAESPDVDAGGAFADENFYYAMVRQMPDLYQPLLKYWFCNQKVELDWAQLLTARGAGAMEASLALGLRRPAPCQIQFWSVPLMKTDVAIVQATAATAARVVGYGRDMFRFPVDAYQISLNVDGSGAVVISFPTVEAASKQDRTVTVARAVQIINAAMVDAKGTDYAHVASIAPGGRIELRSPTTGAGSHVALVAPLANALPILGFSAGTTDGVAADGGGSTYNGTSVFLTAPSNLQMRVSTAPQGSNAAGFRQFTKYLQETDHFRYDAWGFCDFTLGAPEAIVVGKNVRVARVGEIPSN